MTHLPGDAREFFRGGANICAQPSFETMAQSIVDAANQRSKEFEKERASKRRKEARGSPDRAASAAHGRTRARPLQGAAAATARSSPRPPAQPEMDKRQNAWTARGLTQRHNPPDLASRDAPPFASRLARCRRSWRSRGAPRRGPRGSRRGHRGTCPTSGPTLGTNRLRRARASGSGHPTRATQS